MLVRLTLVLCSISSFALAWEPPAKVPPTADPALAAYGIYARSAPNPTKVDAMETRLPLRLEKGERIAFVGNSLLDRSQWFGNFEALLHLAHPDKELFVRNFAWSADEPDLQPRPDNFATVKQHLTRERVDVVIAAFGFNESFGGNERVPEFKSRLSKWVADVKTSSLNGKTGPRIVLLSPIANENIPGVDAADRNNANLAAYSAAIASVAGAEKVGFVDLYAATLPLLADSTSQLTINGVHLNAEGDAAMSGKLFAAMFGVEPPKMNAELRAAVVDKNRQYFRRYRPLNTFYYTGGRNKDYGYLDFLPAMRNFEIMTANRDRRVWDIAQGRSFGGAKVDDSNVPPLEEVTEARGANEWLNPADELKSFRIDPRFDVNLFASEEQFPDLAKPIQMRWDARGRLWVSCSTTYPHVYPGQEPRDKIIILEDTDGDGRADKSKVWADDVHIPLSFELTKNGVYVSEEPHFTLLTDSDGDDRADRREHLLTGFGCEDSHHALHDFVWTPDGDLMFRESIFHNSQVETPYGPVRAKNSAWFLFHPQTHRLTTFGNYPNTNPWGVTFDDWGNHVASHPIFATAFHATNPPYPQQHPAAGKLPAYSGTCGHEFVDFPFWPKELQGGFIKARYKPTNKIEIHQWIEKDDHYEEKFVADLIFSENLSFIPTDVQFGPRGDLYICDWYNPIKGHAQYSLRDPRRDRASGRIWRIVPKGAKLQEPPVIAGAPIASLLELLKRPEYRVRYWTRRELRERDGAQVAAALDAWLPGLDKGDPRYTHHLLEALWTYRSVRAARPELLAQLLKSPDHRARAAAVQQLRHSSATLPEQGIPHLAAAAQDPSQLVRLQAIIAASYIGTPEAMHAVAHIIHHPMGDHLRYAATTALGSEALSRHWQKDPALSAMISPFLKGSAARSKQPKVDHSPKTPEDIAFEKLPGLKTITMATIPERMMFAPVEVSASPGQPIKLILNNPDAMQHNLVVVKPGALEEVGMAGNEMAKDPDGIKKHFVPKSDKVLHATPLVDAGGSTVLRFRAPAEPGVYPYVCTFPGHWVVMNGKLTVK